MFCSVVLPMQNAGLEKSSVGLSKLLANVEDFY